MSSLTRFFHRVKSQLNCCCALFVESELWQKKVKKNECKTMLAKAVVRWKIKQCLFFTKLRELRLTTVFLLRIKRCTLTNWHSTVLDHTAIFIICGEPALITLLIQRQSNLWTTTSFEKFCMNVFQRFSNVSFLPGLDNSIFLFRSWFAI